MATFTFSRGLARQDVKISTDLSTLRERSHSSFSWGESTGNSKILD